MSLFHRLLANLPMTRKLGLGFGFAILFTLLGNLYGLRSLDQLIDGSLLQNRLAEAARLAETIPPLQLRFDKDAHPRHAEQLAALEGGIAELLRGARQDDPRIHREIDANLQRLAAIRTAFDALIAARASREQSRQVMIGNGNKAMAALTALEEQIDAALQANPTDTALHRQNRALGDLVKRVLETRYLVRGFVFQHTDASFELAIPGFQRALNQAATLRQLLPARHVPYLDELSQYLTLYRQGIESFKDGLAQTAAAHAALLEHQSEAVRAIGELNAQVRERMEAQLSLAFQVTLGLMLLAILLGTVAAVVIARQVTEPLRKTLEFAQRITSGDLRADLVSDRHDELGLLQRAMHQMRESLRELIGSIDGSVTRIASSAEELSAISAQTSSGVQHQKAETEQVATAINEMAATVQEVARNAASAAASSNQAEQQAHAGQRVVAAALEQIERMAAQASRSAEAMQRLRHDSQAIGSVLDVIKNVAEQTNLLALNAAIEAARAGEAGRGFAVVADEVRGLAQRTQQSTREIEQLIASLQEAAQHAGQSMDENRTLSEDTVTLARDVGQALRDITAQVSQLQDMSQQIATAAEEQSAVAEEINRSVTQVQDISQQTASASEQAATSTVELARLGGDLRQLTQRFRL